MPEMASMNFFSLIRPRFSALIALVSVAGVVSAAAQDEKKTEFGAAGWLQYSHVGHSSEKTNVYDDYTNRGQHGSGAQITLRSQLTGKLQGNVGLGVASGHFLSGTASGPKGGYSPHGVFPYVAEANFTYNAWKSDRQAISVRGGFFPYNYNPDVKNLGLYLLRGPVYPGILISGFETKHVLPVANMLGVQLRHQFEGFTQDLLLNSETELAPFFDLSLAYLASYQFGEAFRVGAGVNFYHLIPMDGEVTRGEVWPAPGNVVSTTETIGFDGTKVMATASFDPKAFTGDFGMLGASDLRLYGEVALIGLDNDSVHKAIYGDIFSNRMPVMVGFNLPAFKLLDYLSIEVQWYGSKLRDDLTGYNYTSGVRPSPLPVTDPDSNLTRDNWKWSVNGARMLGSHVRLSFQVANDHFRPGTYSGDGDNNPPGRQALLITPKDWYSSLKLAFFF
jgi:hypothetical protein